MFFPELNSLPTGRRLISKFSGLDLRNAISEGAFAAMKNLSSRDYPLLSPRRRRTRVAQTGLLGGMAARDGLCYVNGTDFVINGAPYDLGLTEGEKQLVSMGAYTVIFPDKKYINTLEPADRGSLEATWTSDASVKFTLCDSTGAGYEGMVTGNEAPGSPTNLQYWLDTSVSPCVLRRYSADAETWVEQTTTYVCINAQGIGKGFSQYDGVTLSGIAAQALQSLNGTAVLQVVGDDYIVIPGILGSVVTQDPDQGRVRVERLVPEMDFVIESENRLWGCRYGFDREGNAVNELYACKLGDFKNWSCFQGLSTDSYRVSLGADGPFTGAVTHLGYPLFFREGCLHKVYGNYPENYRIQTTACRGVAQGSHKSLAIVQGALYYLGTSGVCAYDGSLPEEVSAALGQKRFRNGVAGASGSRYYISMTEENGNPGLYVLDTALGLWHREDDLAAQCFCARGEYLLCHDGEYIWELTGASPTDPGVFGAAAVPERRVCWMAQTGPLAAADPEYRYISRITARLQASIGTTVRFSVRYDGSGEWEPLGMIRCMGLRTVSLPLRTRRCESLELRLEGDAEAKLYSLAVTSEQGSDSP